MPKAQDTGPTERYLALPTKEGITLLRVGGALLWVDGGVFLSVYKDIVSFVLFLASFTKILITLNTEISHITSTHGTFYVMLAARSVVHHCTWFVLLCICQMI